MIVLKTQKFDNINRWDRMELIIYIENSRVYCDEIVVKDKETHKNKFQIGSKCDHFSFSNSRGRYDIYLAMIKPDLIWFSKKKNGKIVERHIWKISDYLEETK